MTVQGDKTAAWTHCDGQYLGNFVDLEITLFSGEFYLLLTGNDTLFCVTSPHTAVFFLREVTLSSNQDLLKRKRPNRKSLAFLSCCVCRQPVNDRTDSEQAFAVTKPRIYH